MYWEARINRNVSRTLLFFFFVFKIFFYMLLITNHIADALSDLSWTAVLARTEPYGSIFSSEPFHP